MLLAVDIGNSRTKWGQWDGAGWAAIGNMENAELMRATWLDAMPTPERVVFTCVGAAEIEASVRASALKRWGLAAQRLTSKPHALGVTNGYLDPTRLGADRWVALVAAWHKLHDALCVIDAGTALTIDVVDGEGLHLGGLILPGLAMMQNALVGGTRGVLPGQTMGWDSDWGRDTGSCVGIAVQRAATALVADSLDRLRRDLGTEPLCLVTGGDGLALCDSLGESCRYEPQLVLEGIAILGEEASES